MNSMVGTSQQERREQVSSCFTRAGIESDEHTADELTEILFECLDLPEAVPTQEGVKQTLADFLTDKDHAIKLPGPVGQVVDGLMQLIGHRLIA